MKAPERDLLEEKFTFQERLAICLEAGVPESEALEIANKQLMRMIYRHNDDLHRYQKEKPSGG